MKRKASKWMSLLLTLTMALSLLPTPAAAVELEEPTDLPPQEEAATQEEAAPQETADTPAEETEADVVMAETVETVSWLPDTADLGSEDELLTAYMEHALDDQLHGPQNHAATFGIVARERLTEPEKTIYDKLKNQIDHVAAGTQHSTVFTISETLTPETVGGPVYQISGNQVALTPAAEAKKAELSMTAESARRVADALRNDCPYALYWWDKTSQLQMGLQETPSKTGSLNPQDIPTLTLTIQLTFTYVVSQDYGSGTTTNTRPEKVQTALNTAAEIINNAKSKGELEKLQYFKDEICRLTSYNDEAAKDTYTGGYGDPWQLIYVFDGDTSTNVVCEGYAKAFQYLCDQSGLDCISVTGQLSGGGASGGSGGHMWNVVTLEGKNYLVDVTNCDEGTVGAPDKLFLKAPASGSMENGYTIVNTTFTYDQETKNLYGSEVLTLATQSYAPPQQITGTVAIDGTAKIGEILTANVTGAPQDATLVYQWYRGDAAISGAAGNTYTPNEAADVNQTIKVVVTADGYIGELSASTTDPVAKGDGPVAPSTPTAKSHTHNSITVDAVSGQEYACVTRGTQPQAGDWKDDSTFTGLTANTTYDIYTRVKATDTHNASPSSAVLTVATKAAPIDKVTVTIDTPKKGQSLPTASVTDQPASVVAKTAWYEGSTASGTPVSGNATAGQVYTAQITLTATDPSFADSVSVTLNNESPANVTPDGSGNLVITKTFSPTAEKTITKIEITTEPKKDYVEGENFDPAGMVVKATYDDGTVDEQFTAYTVEGGQNLQKGTTSVTIKAGNVNTTVAITVKGKLKADDFTYTAPADLTYDGQPKNAVVEYAKGITVDKAGAITVSYSTADPTNAGEYTVYIETAGGTEYAPLSKLEIGRFTITKATPVITVDPSKTVVKNVPVALGAAIQPAGLPLTYTSSPVGIVEVDAQGSVTGVTTGDATITVSFAGNNNYEAASKTVQVKVTEKNPVTVTFTAKAEQPYKPEGYALGEQFNAATVDGGKAITGYRYGGQNYLTLEELKAVTVTDVDTYSVTAYYESDTEYGEAMANFTIAKADQAELAITSTNGTFSQPLTLTTSGGSGAGKVTYVIAEGGTGKGVIDGDQLTAETAGTIMVKAAKAGDDHYNAVESKAAAITIAKAAAVTLADKTIQFKAGTTGEKTVNLSGLMPDDAGALTYTKGTESQTGAVAVSSWSVDNSTGLVKFALTGGAANDTVTLPVTITSTNYADSTVNVVITLTDKEVPTVTVEPITVTYTGEAIPASAIKGTAKVGDSVVEGTWNWKLNAPVRVADSGTVAVTFNPTETEKYAAVEAAVQVTINKAMPTGTPSYTKLTAGQKLSDAKLGVGSIQPAGGTIQWVDPESTVVVEGASYQWKYTPTDPNYESLTGSVVLAQSTPKPNPNPDGGSSSGGSSSGGGSYNPPSKTETTKNPDGSTTTTVTKADGTKVETTKGTDGSQTVVETKKDGTVITTETDKSGNKTKTVENKDGSSVTEVKRTNGTTSKTTVNRYGNTESEVKVSGTAVKEAVREQRPLELPMPPVRAEYQSNDAPVVKVDVPTGTAIDVSVPVTYPTSGTVAVVVHPDGREEVVRKSTVDGNGVTFAVNGDTTVKIVDNTKYFADVPTRYWAADNIAFVTARGLYNGTSASTFSPEKGMTRGMLAKVLHNLENNPQSGMSAAFTDVNADTWCQEAVSWAADAGIITGYADGSFHQEKMINREQLAVMLYRYAGSPAHHGTALNFSDANRLSGYAQDAMSWAVENGIIGGTAQGTLNPQGTATRAQVAAMLTRFLNQ